MNFLAKNKSIKDIKNMITKEFAEATAELNIILKYVPIEYVEKIPKKLRNTFKNIESKNHIIKIDLNKNLEEQELKEKTKDLIAVIYRNYWCNEEEKKELDIQLIQNEKKREEELKEKYNTNNIFKNRTEVKKEEIKIEQEYMIEYKESIFKRFINKIKRFFHIKKL